MKILWRRIIALLAAFGLLTGCTLTERIGQNDQSTGENASMSESSAPAEPGYFGLAYYSNEKVNPVLSESRINRILIDALYEGLFVLDRNFTPQTVLCENYSGDGVNWTFTLRNGITFWSGEPLRASDVVYSYQTAMSNTNSLYYNRLQQVQSVTAANDTTIQIVLKTPNTQFPCLLDIPIFRQGTETNDFSEGTGPYQPQSDGAVRWLVPYAGWHKGQVTTFDYINLVTTVRSDAVVYSFETGDISLTRADRISAAPATFKGTAEVYQTPSTNLHYLGVNYGHAPYQVPAVRQAISSAFDRAHLCQTQLQSFGDPAVLPVNPQPSTSEELQFSILPDTEKALALLAGVGISDTDGDGILEYPAGNGKRQPMKPVILVNSENSFKVAVTQQVIADLEQIGIRATMNAVPFEEFQSAIANSKYDFYYGETIMTADFDLQPLVSSGGALNLSGYANTLTDSILTQYHAATGANLEPAQTALYNHLLTMMPIIPIAFTRGQVITRSGLMKGFTPGPFNSFYQVEQWKVE